MTDPEPLWEPSESRVAGSRLAEFERNLRDALGLEFRSYDELHRWSVDQPEDFWGAVWRFCDVRHRSDVTAVLQEADRFPGARWFEGARLNDESTDQEAGPAAAGAHDARVPPLSFAQLPFDHPLFILFSSGTTGVPKCIVHGAGGTLLQHLKEHQLHVGLRPGDVFFYYTTCGWMMWNWMVSALATGATLVLYDGSPFHPGPESLLDLVDAENVAVLGVGAKYISAIEKAGLKPRESHDLASLRTVLSTGSPLSPESFRYVYRDVKTDLCLSSISGGTDIISCFVLGNECLPVYEGELQCPGLGMAVAVWDDTGKAVRETKGELVCTRPFPSAPLGFWNDPDGQRYHKAYFATYPGIWAHGDYAEITARGGMIIPVTDIPRTRSGKIAEIAVRDAIHGKAIGNASALSNPDSLDQFRDLEELALPVP